VRRRADARPFVVAAAYSAAMTFFIYGIEDRDVGYGSDVANWIGIAALTALHLATGWGVGRWWAVVLPLLAIPIAIPAGYPARTEGPEIWVGVAWVLAPAGVILIALAVAIRRLQASP
jgi:peptidoglycan/LPS O-acetylase OafA/YrhL